ncbi:hypothetical protein SAMN04489760_11241 [Syntrophus gentianae]|uniref:Uncharacterized protein n=1 Tax=Syntrophus gentianae TaxID=43775 RepID=A0A1H7XUP5_9BACT|nr:hypothetical protein SAMN04489760_11241 [Syntrophus gentianae]
MNGFLIQGFMIFDVGGMSSVIGSEWLENGIRDIPG